MTLQVSLEPFDTLHFAEGRPFNQDDEGLTEAASLFPPLPHQIGDCVRAAVAAALGAPEPTRHRWSPKMPVTLSDGRSIALGDIVGDGRWDYGALRLSGARLHARDREWTACPLTVLQPPEGESDASYFVPGGDVVAPLGDEVVWDLDGGLRSAVAYGLAARDVTKTSAVDWHIERSAFRQMLGRPDELVSRADLAAPEELWAREKYLGLELAPRAKRAVDGMLYTATHLRPAETAFDDPWRLRVDLDVLLEPALAAVVMERLAGADMVAPLGGRGRAARLTAQEPATDDKAAEPVVSPTGATPIARVYLVAPALMDATASSAFLPDAPFLGVVGTRLVTGVCERARRTALWDGETGGRTAWMWRLPAGAAFDVAFEDDEAMTALRRRLHDAGLNVLGEPGRAGQARAMGYGETVIGAVPGTLAQSEEKE